MCLPVYRRRRDIERAISGAEDVREIHTHRQSLAENVTGRQVVEMRQCRWHPMCRLVPALKIFQTRTSTSHTYLASGAAFRRRIRLQMRTNHGNEDVVLYSSKKVHAQVQAAIYFPTTFNPGT